MTERDDPADTASGIGPGTAPRGYSPRARPRWWLVMLIVLGHVALGALLLRFLAPDFTAGMVETAREGLTVIITTPPEDPPLPEPDAGAQGDPGREATAQARSAPPNPMASPSSVPRAASTGVDNASGARLEGDGTGNRGTGDGTGSGNGGQGRGGGIARGPSVRSGELNVATDFPIPPGGRQTRFGLSVTVHFTVGLDGVARDCVVADSQVDAAATARACPLVIEKIRFNPALRADGTPVEARYGYRIDFRRRD